MALFWFLLLWLFGPAAEAGEDWPECELFGGDDGM